MSRGWARSCVGVAVSSVLLVLAGTSPAAAKVAPEPVAGWVTPAVLGSGAIASYPDRQRVLPYLANFAAWGLADHAGRTRDSAALGRAWGQLRWYSSAQDVNGYVTDYTVAPDGSLATTGDMDSTDSYAATFLLAVEAAYKASRVVEGSSKARARLKGLRAGLDGALRAVESTADADGLTWAKPSWRVKYLMDQAEVYAGLAAGGRLFATLGDRSRRDRAKVLSAAVRSGVESWWDPVTGTYDWARHADGSDTEADLSVAYPDALEQLWAVGFGLVPADRAHALVSRVMALHPELADPSATMTTSWGTAPVDYWPLAALAWVQVGEKAKADELLTAIEAVASARGRPWPYNAGVAGQTLIVAGRIAGM